MDSKKAYGWLAVLIVSVCVINIVWIRQDESIMTGDAYAYMENLLKVIDSFDPSGPSDVWKSLKRLSFGGRPPVYQLMTVPFVLVFGRSVDDLLLVNTLLMAVLMLATYGVAAQVVNPKAGLLAAFLVASYPPIVHLSRMYFPYFAVPVFGALALWALVLLLRDRSVKMAWLFSGALALGLLMHPSFLWIALTPAALGCVYLTFFYAEPRMPSGPRDVPGWLWGKLRDRFFLLGLLPALLAGAGLTFSWYLTRGLELYKMRQNIASRELAEFTGKEYIRVNGFPEIEPTVLWYALTSPGVISYPLAIFAFMGLVASLFKKRFVLWLLALTFIARYFLQAKVFSWWSMSSLLPVAAILTAIWVFEIRQKWVSQTLAAVCVLVGAFNLSVVTWGVPSWNQPVAEALGARFDRPSCITRNTLAFCSSPARPDHENWPLQEIFRRIGEDPTCQQRKCKLMTVHMGDMKIARLRNILIRDQVQHIKLTTPGEEYWGQRYGLRALLESDYLLYPDWKTPNKPAYHWATIRLLQSPPASFQDAHEIVFSFEVAKNRQAHLVKRARSLKAREAEDMIAALKLDEKYLAGRFWLLAQLYAQEGNIEKATLFYEGMADSPQKSQSRRQLNRIFRSQGITETVFAPEGGASEADSQHVGARVRRAQELVKIGREDQAIRVLQELITTVPENSLPRRVLGEIYGSQGQGEQAVKHLQEAVEINPGSLHARIRLAQQYVKLRQFDNAIAELKTAIESHPENSWPRRVLGELYRTQKQNSEAIALFEQAIRIDPKDLDSRLLLARTYRRVQRTEDAIRELETAISVAPRNARPRRLLGTYYAESGQKAQAIAMYEEVLRLDPKDGYARKALAKLRSSG